MGHEDAIEYARIEVMCGASDEVARVYTTEMQHHIVEPPDCHLKGTLGWDGVVDEEQV